MEAIHVSGLWDDGNIFSIAGKAAKALRRADRAADADDLWVKVRAAQNYDAAIRAVMEYADDSAGGA